MVFPKTGVMKTIMTYNPFTPFILTIRDVAVGSSPEFLNYFIGPNRAWDSLVFYWASYL